MEIISARYANLENSYTQIMFDDGIERGQNVNVRGQYTDQLDEWLAVPNTIEAYDANYGKTPEQIQAEEIAQAEVAVKSYVQVPIDNYNTLVGTSFESVYNCTTYKDVDTYPHQLMCQQAVEWNALVWGTSRQVQVDIAMGITPKPESIDEFIALLPAIPTFG